VDVETYRLRSAAALAGILWPVQARSTHSPSARARETRAHRVRLNSFRHRDVPGPLSISLSLGKWPPQTPDLEEALGRRCLAPALVDLRLGGLCGADYGHHRIAARPRIVVAQLGALGDFGQWIAASVSWNQLAARLPFQTVQPRPV
jgi:hypothetical protein